MEEKLVINIETLEIPINSSFPIKATSDTNIDMVKPILDIKDTKNIETHLKSLGFFVIPNKSLKYVKIIIPEGFPSNRPR